MKDKLKIAILGIVISFAIYLLANFAVVIVIKYILNLRSINIMVLQGIANGVSIIALMPYYAWFKKKYTINESKLEFIKVFYIIAISFALCIILNILIDFIPREHENIVTENINQLSKDYTPILSLAIVSITAPIIEEMIFRGFFYDSIKLIANDIIAIILTSFTFGIFHFDMQQIIYAMIVGIVLALLKYKFKNVLYPIIMHATMNTTSLLILPGISADKSLRSVLFNLFISSSILVFSIIRFNIKNNND